MTIKRKTSLKRSTKPIARSPIKKKRTKPRLSRLTPAEMTVLRRKVFERDLYQCQHVIDDGTVLGGYSCRRRVTWETGHLAHIISRGRGGPDTAENTCCKCPDCHIVKEHSYGKSGVKPVPKKPA